MSHRVKGKHKLEANEKEKEIKGRWAGSMKEGGNMTKQSYLKERK